MQESKKNRKNGTVQKQKRKKIGGVCTNRNLPLTVRRFTIIWIVALQIRALVDALIVLMQMRMRRMMGGVATTGSRYMTVRMTVVCMMIERMW